MWWSASIAPTAKWRRAARDPIRQKSRYRATHIWMRNSLDWTTSKKRRFSDILVTALSPTRRGPGSYQYRVKLKRRGPAVKHPPGFFVGHKLLMTSAALWGRRFRLPTRSPGEHLFSRKAPPCAPRRIWYGNVRGALGWTRQS